MFSMNARDVFLTQLMQGPKQFLIPIFQRTYSWTQVNCDQLFKDIHHAGVNAFVQNHFIGSLVLIQSQQSTASIPQWQVIDGQQRLTTVSILIAALLDKAKELKHEVIAATPIAGIRDYYLANAYGQDDTRYKLLLTKGDKKSLFDLVDGKSLDDNSATNVCNNYEFFRDSFTDIASIDTIYQGLQKLKVVEVVLQPGSDDPQAIFESLNSTGVDLSQADLIRNYVLMRQEYDAQTTLYEDKWFPMEQAFGNAYGEKFDRFAQDFLTIKLQSNSLLKSRDVYPSFKQWFQTAIDKQDVNTVLDELCQYAGYYCAFSLSQETDKSLQKAFNDLRPLVEVATPVVMRFYVLYEQDKATKGDFIDAIQLLSSYVLRRSICDMQTRSLGNIFAALSHKISDEKPLESLKVSLARFSKNSRFPNDNEFEQALLHRDLYDSRNCRFVLDRLENDSKERIDTSTFTIEHVIPQNEDLNKDWRTMLGDNWKEIQETWLHRLGNLTLTGYNSEYQDRGFIKKKTMSGGFDDSPLRLNKDMRDATAWTPIEMDKRGEKLAKNALTIWPKLDVNGTLVAEYVLQDKKLQAAEYQLDDVSGIKEGTKVLAEQLQKAVLNIAPDTSVIPTKRNITFYLLEAFAQAIPRTNYLAIILCLDMEDVEELGVKYFDIFTDTNNWSYITNGDLKGVYCAVASEEDIATITPALKLAYERSIA
jgi:uncharacterized protein with ParB-like and HNH nuclease domain